MKKRRNDLRLEECFLYAISSPKELAYRLSTKSFRLAESDLKNFASDSNYKLFKVDGRPIQEPKAKLQVVHRRVHRLLSRVAVPDYLHSAVKGKSYLSNATAHSAGNAVIKVDIKKFFASVPVEAVVRFLRKSCRCRSDVAKLLSNILVFNGRIATGSSASPILAYYAYKPMFDEIATLADECGLTFTCYVDDMTLSGPAATKATMMKVRGIISRYGLKSHKMRVFKPNVPKVITGVCISSDGPRVPNKLHLKISQDFQSWAGEATPEQRRKMRASLLGRLQAAGRIDPVYRARATTLQSVAPEEPA